jgi:hypothetical protein
MPGSEDSRSRSAHVMAPHTWQSARILDAVCQVNEHLVSALIEMARHGNVSTVLVRQNVDVLRRMDLAACKRAARIPVILLDLHFQREDWWRNAGRPNGEYRATAPIASSFPADYAAELTRESLIVAWLAVQRARRSANLLFGMTDAVANFIGELTPQELNRIAERSSHELRIRWQSKPEFWRKLLLAGQSGSANDLCEIHLFGLQLLGGDLMNMR